ncbi:hypothetical protein [Pedobacter nyackensis]|uniref:Uncharacterized protein n=1 Tax=Pedobacter nyackensis TaxID=475255 RepID=A0A1W2DL61_9SPHI|nr:hypothetical protein [Pedobacter nyackensis]SMC98163.1 hypothetical protein SAMN04488101_107146 [Pedobacter nyackensis]
MKKLFFIAALAMVAIGGAFAQYSTTQFGPDEFNCTIAAAPLCGTEVVGTFYLAGSAEEAPAGAYDLQYVDNINP